MKSLSRFFKPLALFFVLVATALPALAQTSAHSCSAVFALRSAHFHEEATELFGRILPVLRVPLKNLMYGTFSASKLSDGNSIFIGVNPQGHMYMVAGNRRYDGEFFHAGSPRLRDSDLLSQGLVLQVQDSTGQLRRGFEEYFARGLPGRSINCVSGVCSVIRKGSTLRVGESQLRAIFPDRFFKKVIENGFRDDHGNQLAAKLIVIGDHDVNAMMTNMRSETRWRGAPYAVIGFTLFALPLQWILPAVLN